MEYFNQEKNSNPGSGALLLSEPMLADPNFTRTVILLCENNDEGAVGFVLNKPSVLRFGDVFQEYEDFDADLYVGGPVEQDTLHFIHRSPELISGGKEIHPGIFWGGEFDSLVSGIEMNTIDPNDFKFFLGYSGWDHQQLIDELKSNSWIVKNRYSKDQLFESDPDQLWKESLQEMGGKYRMFTNYPTDPRLN